jgi:hypothetical protein
MPSQNKSKSSSRSAQGSSRTQQGKSGKSLRKDTRRNGGMESSSKSSGRKS